MQKIPTIFLRNLENMKEILTTHNPDYLWVFNNEGKATRKYDGTCCLIKNRNFFKRREIKKGKTSPIDFIQESYDEITGKKTGWVPVIDSNENKYHLEAFNNHIFLDGTYELVGPKIQGNPEHYDSHVLIPHSTAEEFYNIPVDFDNLKKWLTGRDIEGIVFHHSDGRMGKIKQCDFGLIRGEY